MNKYLFSFLLSVMLLLGGHSFGQQYFELRYQLDVKIAAEQNNFQNPWTGGVNSAIFSKIELNQDGTEDLFVFDKTQNKVLTYLAQQVNGQWTWKYQPEYEMLFPEGLQDWVLLRDFNLDGRKDIFTKSNLGIKVFLNTTPAAGPLAFKLAEDFIRYNNGVNIQVSGDDLPSIVDMDNDTDLDILCFDFFSGHTIQLYKNLRMEDNLAPDSLRFKLEDPNWGKLTKCEDVCGRYVFNGACRTSRPKHSVPASVLAIDLDNDQDKDVLLGGDQCSDLVQITNEGTPLKAIMSNAGVKKVFPGNTTPANFNLFLAPYYEDVTFDNIPDLLVSPFVPANTDLVDTRQSVWLYQNTNASNTSPVFSFKQKNFLQDNTLDIGEDSAPAFADIDADGDLDMLVGNYGTLRNGSAISSLYLYKNTGSVNEPSFTFETEDYANLASLGLQGIQPRFADVNGDGSLDLTFTVLNSSTGSNKYILNKAAPGQAFSFDVTKVVSLPVGLNMGDIACFYDVDRDGDQDVIIGASIQISETSGPLLFYRNTGTAAKPVYTLADESFGGISYGEETNRFIYPLIADLNNDNSPELITADSKGILKIYPDFLSDLNASFQTKEALFANSVNNKLVSSQLGGHVALAAADLNGDMQPEIIVGNTGGGLLYITQQLKTATGLNEELKEQLNISVFPNPANQEVTIDSPEKISVVIYNSEGKKVISTVSSFARHHTFNVGNWAAGLYYVQVQTTEGKTAGYKLLVKK